MSYGDAVGYELTTGELALIQQLVAPTAGDYLYGANAAGNAGEWKHLIAGTGIDISHGVGTITISNTGLSESIDDRVAALIQNGTGISWTYDDSANTLTPAVSIASFSTTNLAEGSNLYYTDERVDDRVAALLVEGSGVSISYNDVANTLTISSTGGYGDENVDDRVALLIQNGTGISWSYNDGANTLTPTISLASFTTANLTENTNLYYTDARVRANRLDQMAVPTADVSLNSHKLTNVTDPTSDQDAATKAYVDAVAQGLSVKNSVYLATNAALPTNTYSNGSSGVGATLTGVGLGALTVDSVAVTIGDRILVKDESTGANNGIYTVTVAGSAGAAYVLTRALDFNQPAEIPGAFTFVEAGTVNVDAGFVCTNASTVTIGTTAIAFTQFSGAGQITAGAGLTKTANTINAVGTTNRIVVNADSIDLGSDVYTVAGTDVALADGGTGASLTDPNADRMMFWDDSAGSMAWLTPGTGLSITTTTINVDLDTDGTLAANSDTKIASQKAIKTYADTKQASLGFTPTPLSGWNSDANTWTYSSVDGATGIVSINADMTGILQPGDRIKLTQTTAKYFIVTAVGAYSGGVTLVTMWGGTDYTLANAAITSPNYSHVKSPFGFPMSPSKWTVKVTDTTDRSQSSPVAGTWYNPGAISISIPIGEWVVSWQAMVQFLGSSVSGSVYGTLSTANNSSSDGGFTAGGVQVTSSNFSCSCMRSKNLSVATKTSYYMNIYTPSASITTILFPNSYENLSIMAICAYL